MFKQRLEQACNNKDEFNQRFKRFNVSVNSKIQNKRRKRNRLLGLDVLPMTIFEERKF
jgi:hypothetical protein